MFINLQKNPGLKWILIGAVSNLALSLVKIAGGILGQSTAMIADGVHSASDLLTDGIVLFTHRIGQLPADENHPYGHGRAETIGATVVGAVIIAAGIGLAYEAWVIISTETLKTPVIPAAVAAVVSIAINEWLFRYTRSVGEQIKSQSLVANAWHHRSDAISSVAALVGIGGAMAGYPIMDPIAAIIVAVLVGKVGYDIAFSGLTDLMDTGLNEDETSRLEAIVQQVPGVVRFHSLRTRKIGSEVLMDVHILVDREASVSEGHQIAEAVRRKIIRQFEEIPEVLIHVDTEDDAEFEPIYWASGEDIRKLADPLIASIPEVVTRTNLRTHYHRGETQLEVAIKLKPGLDLEATEAAVKKLKEKLITIEHVHEVRVFIDTNSN